MIGSKHVHSLRTPHPDLTHTTDHSSITSASAHLRTNTPPNALHSSPQFLPSLIHLPSSVELRKKRKRVRESKNKGVASGQIKHGVCVRVFGSCVRTGGPVSTSVCEVQLKSNSSEQVFASNDLSLLSISLLTTSCRGRDGQGQTWPRQMERHIKRREQREQGGRREKST